jgi:predicted nucleotidyltransferase|tara:strand:- start:2132 stop:2860 length:729 start_codon:yes stop_codon:yes gene_type:complete
MENNKLLEEKYNKIALEFLEKMRKKFDIVCVLLTGSYFTKKLTKKSDLDVFLITNTSNLREKGVNIIKGVKVSYFLNPYWKIIKLLNSEKNKLKRPTAEFIYFSDCLIGEEKARPLKKIAKKTINSSIPKIDVKEKSYLGWKIYDKLEVFKRENYNSFNKEYLKFNLFELLINTFFLIKKSYRPHSKYTLEKINTIDKIFHKKIEKFLKNESNSNLIYLSNYLLKLLNFSSEDYFKREKTFN